MKRLAALALLAALPVAASAQEAPAPNPPAITVAGEGAAAVPPDLAIIQSGVVTRAAAAGEALKANASAMSKVLAAVKAAGVDERDVGSSGLSVQPQYDYGDGSTPRAPRLVGYEVRNTVTIRSRAVDRLGELIDALVAAGSNQIDNLVFDVSDRETRLDEARRGALADARRKAELYAAAAGVKLGALISLDEQDVAEAPPRPMAMRAKAMDAAPTPIARGEQELRARVTARWSIER